MFQRLLLLGAAALLAAGCSRSTPAGPADAPAPPRVSGDTVNFVAGSPQLAYLASATVQRRQAATLAVTGRLAWDDDVTARIFPPVSGRLVQVMAAPGQPVAAGEALARIRSADFGLAQADAAKAATDFTLAERALHRQRDLLAHHAAAEKDVESAQADYAHAVSEKQRADAALAVNAAEGGGSTVDGLFVLRASVPGVVVDRAVSPGQEIRSDQIGDRPLFVISNPQLLWLFLDVTETDVVWLRPGEEVAIHAREFPNQVFHGRLEVVGAGLDPGSRTVKARCVVLNPGGVLRAEMYVSADLTEPSADGVDVPTSAIFLKENQAYVFVETGPQRFERRKVTVGSEHGERSAIAAGLSGGERVVTDGCLLLEAVLENSNP